VALTVALILLAAVLVAGVGALIRDLARQARGVSASGRAARARAEALLLTCLSPVQRSEYKRRRFFHVTGSVTGRTYRVLRRRAGSVQAIDVLGRPTDAYCTLLPEGAPIEDQMLVQKFMLETDEPGFLDLAGRTWPARLEAAPAATMNARQWPPCMATMRVAPSAEPGSLAAPSQPRRSPRPRRGQA
jgi:hypothetical protein